MLCALREHHHKLTHIHRHKLPPFYTKKQFLVFDCFDYCNGSNVYHRFCVVDDKNRRFCQAIVENPDYKEDVNYTTVTRLTFDTLSNQ